MLTLFFPFTRNILEMFNALQELLCCTKFVCSFFKNTLVYLPFIPHQALVLARAHHVDGTSLLASLNMSVLEKALTDK